MEAAMFQKAFVFFVMLLTAFPAFATNRKAAILGFEVDGGVDAQLGKTATTTLMGLAKAQSGWKLLPPSEFEENKLLYCEEEDVEKCVRKIATALQVDILVTGRISKEGSQLKFNLFFYQNKEYKYASFLLSPSKKGDLPKLLTEHWNNQFQAKVAQLDIVSPEADAKVFIDGVFVLSTVKGANSIPSIPPGPHQIVVKSKAGAEWKTSVTVKAGETISVTVEFPAAPEPVVKDPTVKEPTVKEPTVKEPVVVVEPGKTGDATEQGVVPPPEKKPEEKGEPVNLWKVGFWSSAATAVVLIGAGTYTGLQVLSYEDEKEKIMKNSLNPNEYVGKNDVCKNPTAEMKDTCDNGKAYAMYTNILFAAGFTVGLVSTYFLYKGYLQSTPDVNGRVDATDGASVRLMPFLSPDGAGFSLGFSF